MVLACNARFYWSNWCNCAMTLKFKMAVYRGETHDNLWGKAIEKVKNVFGIPSLHTEQEEALRQFFSNQTVFVNLPTSFGKSLIFQATPIMADVLLRRSEGTCIVIVISPLKSLMEDQVRHLKNLNISAVSVTDEHNDRIVGDIIDGKYSLCMVHQNVFSKLHGGDYFRANNLDPLWCVLLLMKHIASVNGKCVI